MNCLSALKVKPKAVKEFRLMASFSFAPYMLFTFAPPPYIFD